MSAQKAIVRELMDAAARMSRHELLLGDALLELAADVVVVVEMLDTLAGQDESIAALVQPLSGMLREAGRRAAGTHAAVVGEINQATSH